MSKTLPIVGTETFCNCKVCESMCDRPCWPTPREALALIQKGYGARLMRDYWQGSISGALGDSYYDIGILCGANKGYESNSAPFWPRNLPCVLQTPDKLCMVHNTCKPIEGRLADCKDKTPDNLHQNVAELWENKQAQRLVELWQDAYMNEDLECPVDWDKFELPEEPEHIATSSITRSAPEVRYQRDDKVEVLRSDGVTWSPGIILRREGDFWVTRIVRNETLSEYDRGYHGYKSIRVTDAKTYIRKVTNG